MKFVAVAACTSGITHTYSQGYTYGLFVALVESGILFALPLGGML